MLIRRIIEPSPSVDMLEAVSYTAFDTDGLPYAISRIDASS